MSHANTYGEGGTATREECLIEALRDAHWQYTQAGGTLSYEEWCDTSEESKRIHHHYRKV